MSESTRVMPKAEGGRREASAPWEHFDGSKGDEWAPLGPVLEDAGIEDPLQRWASRFNY